jgi:hypothetical protein
MAAETAAVVGVASSFLGILSFGISLCKGLKDYYSAVKGADRNVLSLCESVDALNDTLNLVDVTVRCPGISVTWSAKALQHIPSCRTALRHLDEEISRIRGYPSNQVFSRFHRKKLLYPFQERTLRALKTSADDLLASLELTLQTLHL